MDVTTTGPVESRDWYIATVTRNGEVHDVEYTGDNTLSLLQEALSSHAEGKPAPERTQAAKRLSDFMSEPDVAKTDIAGAVQAAFILNRGLWAGRNLAFISKKSTEYPQGFGGFNPLAKRAEVRSLHTQLGLMRNGVENYKNTKIIPQMLTTFSSAMATVYKEDFRYGQYLVNYTQNQYVKETQLAAAVAALTWWQSPDNHGIWAGDKLAIISAREYEEMVLPNSADWKDASESLKDKAQVLPNGDIQALDNLDKTHLVADYLTILEVEKEIANDKYRLLFSKGAWEQLSGYKVQLLDVVNCLDSDILAASSSGESHTGFKHYNIANAADIVEDCLKAWCKGKEDCNKDFEVNFTDTLWQKFEDSMVHLYMVLDQIKSMLEAASDKQTIRRLEKQVEESNSLRSERENEEWQAQHQRRRPQQNGEAEVRCGLQGSAALDSHRIGRHPCCDAPASRELLFLIVTMSYFVCILAWRPVHDTLYSRPLL
jgi:hypothetical protein